MLERRVLEFESRLENSLKMEIDRFEREFKMRIFTLDERTSKLEEKINYFSDM
jgi:hypothetical protein